MLVFFVAQIVYVISQVFVQSPMMYIGAILLFITALFLFTYQSLTVVYLVGQPLYEVLLSIVFSPISWIWYYHRWSKPLKIVAGKKAPPENVEDVSLAIPTSLLQSIPARLCVSVGVVALVFVYAYFRYPSKVSSLRPIESASVQQLPYQSPSDLFKVSFPFVPVVTQDTSVDKRMLMTTTYSSVDVSGVSYAVKAQLLAAEDTQRLQDVNERWTMYEGIAQGMVTKGYQLVQSSRIELHGRPALRAEFKTDDLDAYMVYVIEGQRFYLLAVGSSQVNVDLSTAEAFFQSFQFNP